MYIKKIILIFIILLLSSCILNNNDNNLDNKYKDLSKYISSSLTEKEQNELLKILEERKECKKRINNNLLESVFDGDLTKELNNVKKLREKCANRILPYIAKNSTNEFLKYSNSGNKKLEKKYTQILKEKSKFKKISDYISSNLNKEQKNKVKFLLKELEEKNRKYENILKESIENGNTIKKLEEVKFKRKVDYKKILPYIDDKNIIYFEQYYKSINRKIEKNYINLIKPISNQEIQYNGNIKKKKTDNKKSKKTSGCPCED